MTPVAVAADKRFHRAHVKPARRRGRLRGVLWTIAKGGLVATALLIAVNRGAALLAHAPVLRIDRIVISGNTRVSNGDVLAKLQGLRGENIVWSDLETWRGQLLASPWIQDAAFRRSLPSTIEVVVSERQPIGIARVKGQLYLVDDRGAVIDEYGPQYADVDLPIIDGLSPRSGGEAVISDERGALAARLIQELRTKPQIARTVSQIDVQDLHNASVILNGDPAVIYVGEDHFLSRLESYSSLASALRERVADIDYVDLRFDDRIYVRPGGADRKGAAAGAADPRHAAASRTNTKKH